MDFSSFAAGEAAALLGRLLTRHSASSGEHLQALREAVDAVARSLERPVDADGEIRELAARLSNAAADEIRAARAEAESGLEGARIELGAREAEAATLRADLEVAGRRAEEAERELMAALDSRARLDEALAADLQTVTARLREAEAEAAQLRSERQVLLGEADRMAALFDASSRAASEMAAATSATGLLTDLVKRLSLQFARVALFRVKGTRLEEDHQVGFDEGTGFSTMVIPADADSIVTRALATGMVESLSGEDVAARSGMPAGGSPTSAVALPIRLHGTTIAVVYADDAEMPEAARGRAVHESGVAFARLLVGQVMVLLVRHTHELKTLAELTQYATTLLQEAKEMYQADVEAGGSPEHLRRRLEANIDCASQLYAYRAAMEGTAAAALLDQQIAAAIEGASPFARDLATVVAGLTAAELQLTAEPS